MNTTESLAIIGAFGTICFMVGVFAGAVWKMRR
jgi:hypothetical protein